MAEHNTKLIPIILITTQEILQGRKSSLIILRLFPFPAKILRISLNERQIHLPRKSITLERLSLASPPDPSQDKQLLDKGEVLLRLELTWSEVDHQRPSI